jgi:CRP-like cAMP-binding protein
MLTSYSQRFKIMLSVAEQLKIHLNKTVPFSADEVTKLLDLSKETVLKKKEFLFIEGDYAKYVGYLYKGCLRYYRTDEHGEEHIIYFAIEDWWIGDLSSFYSGMPTLFNLQALESTTLYLFTREKFDLLRQTIPSFDAYCKIRHAKAADARTQTMMAQRMESAESRYTKLVAGFPDIFQRVPQHYIASFLGIQPQSLSRIRKKISENKK